LLGVPADARIQVAYSDGPASPRLSPAEALEAAGVSGEPAVLLGLTVDRLAWLDDPDLRGATFLPGYALARAVNDGRLTPLSIRLSSVPSMLAERPPQVGVIAVVRRRDGFAFAGSVGWADVLARTAERLVLEVDEQGVDLGGPPVDELAGDRVVAVVIRPQHDVTAAAQRPADEIDLRIGAAVAGLVPDDATLQFGPGGIGEGIATALYQPVRIRSGLVTDAMASLHDRGLLAAPVLASYTWGGDPIRRLAEAGMLRLTSITETNEPGLISQVPRFVACNTALQVGLDGSVNIERVGGRVITGIGGHADFCAGASRSVGGLSIIAVRSTASDGSPTIVEQVELVSTPRCDIDIVVTELGVADLRGTTDAARRARLLAISGR
jgi:acyl-CoA hydrolase